MASEGVSTGHQVANYCPPPEQPWLPVYQDDHVLVVNKPAGLLTVPGRGAHLQDCLIHRVQRYCPEARIVHRLDMDTSGLVLLGVGADAQRALSLMFMDRRVDKVYQALVHGTPDPSEGCIDLPLLVDWENRPKQKVDLIHGKPSRTDYQVLSVSDHPVVASRLSLKPLTGRSHQLRVHCLSIGHPIIGDPLYAKTHEAHHSTMSRLMLHATQLTFTHPFTQTSLCLHSICPF